MNPRFTITHKMTAGLTRIERARGFLEAADQGFMKYRDRIATKITTNL
ncbi:MAG: hypothetical protein AB7U82_02610 [Blastocatellales bacterium]